MNTKDKLQFLRFSLVLNGCALVVFILALIFKMTILTITGWVLLIGALTIRYWYIPKKDRIEKNAKLKLVEVKSSEVLGIGDHLKIYWDKFIVWLNT